MEKISGGKVSNISGLTLEVLGAYLYKKRTEAKLKPNQLAEKINEPKYWLRELERGTFGVPYPAVIKKLADFYGITSCYLLYLAGFDLKEEITARTKWEDYEKNPGGEPTEEIETIKGWQKIQHSERS